MRKIEKNIAIKSDADIIWSIMTNISGYRTWNPVVKHAAIYGPVVAGTGLKTLIGKWDFEFTIIKAVEPRELEIQGSSVGINLKLEFKIESRDDESMVRVIARESGWISRIFGKKVRTNLEETLEIYLNSLKRKALGGGSYEIKRDDSEHEEPHSDSISMPTPFNLIYKTRAKRFRRGGSGIR